MYDTFWGRMPSRFLEKKSCFYYVSSSLECSNIQNGLLKLSNRETVRLLQLMLGRESRSTVEGKAKRRRSASDHFDAIRC